MRPDGANALYMRLADPEATVLPTLGFLGEF
jgi:hypothetical protein